jgi:hypothetical protein
MPCPNLPVTFRPARGTMAGNTPYRTHGEAEGRTGRLARTVRSVPPADDGDVTAA